MALTKIEWVDHSANAVRVKDGKVWPHGYHCTKVSPGCAHCYAEKLNIMRGTGLPFDDREVEFYLDLSVFDKLPKNKAVTVFVQSMGDIFHEQIPFEFIDQMFLPMLASYGRNRFLFLTKRPGRMAEYFNSKSASLQRNEKFWVGTTVENEDYLWRIDELVKVRAARYFLSIEPCLGPVDIREYLVESGYESGGPQGWITTFTGIDWVIIGAESGPKRRECKIEDVRNVVGQCKEYGIPVFVKQLHINGKLSKKMAEWPKDLRIRQFPILS